MKIETMSSANAKYKVGKSIIPILSLLLKSAAKETLRISITKPITRNVIIGHGVQGFFDRVGGACT